MTSKQFSRIFYDKVWRPPRKKNWFKNISLDPSMSSHSSARKVVNICNVLQQVIRVIFLLKAPRGSLSWRQLSDTLCTLLWKIHSKMTHCHINGVEEEKSSRWHTHDLIVHTFLMNFFLLTQVSRQKQEISMLRNFLRARAINFLTCACNLIFFAVIFSSSSLSMWRKTILMCVSVVAWCCDWAICFWWLNFICVVRQKEEKKFTHKWMKKNCIIG